MPASARARRRTFSASCAVEIHTFWPETMYLLPRFSALVLSLRVLSPVFGSVTAKQARSFPSMSGGSMRRFCSSVPKTTTGLRPKMFMCTVEAPEKPAPDSAIACIITAASVMPRPEPPNCSGLAMPSQPSLASAWGPALVDERWVEAVRKVVLLRPVALEPIVVAEARAQLRDRLLDALLLGAEG